MGNGIENVFVSMVIENIETLRSGELSKSKFIGRYMERINKADPKNSFRFKRPQVIGDKEAPRNNWIDYILAMNEDEFKYFKQAITS